MQEHHGVFSVRWFSARGGEDLDLQVGSLRQIRIWEDKIGLGDPPSDADEVWVIVVSKVFPLGDRARMMAAISPRDLIPGSVTLGASAFYWEEPLRNVS